METYKNDYRKEEDEMLWELHEIRHQLFTEYKKMTIDEINEKANILMENAKKKYSQKEKV